MNAKLAILLYVVAIIVFFIDERMGFIMLIIALKADIEVNRIFCRNLSDIILEFIEKCKVK